jgi:2-polyprenyl-3-methyl-5-hydroxy-6-metoxy-1,4-benzoquinol methylase
MSRVSMRGIVKKLLPVGSERRALAKKAGSLVLGERPFKCPSHLRAKQRHLSEEKKNRFIQSLKDNYFSDPYYYPDPVEEYLATPYGQKDFMKHVSGRLEGDRNFIVPWLNEVLPLKDARILEIGCGTGSSTVALAEQGAHVVGVDVHKGPLKAAEDRCKAYGVHAEFVLCNATEVRENLAGREFDFILFFATLEHMTLDERLTSLRAAWQMLSPGKCLAVIEAPNRLWYYDHHTSFAPYFLWLPDDLAFLYSRLTPREIYNRAFESPTEEARLLFSRWGRGVSFHEFVLAFECPAEKLPVVSCKTLFLRKKTRSQRLYRWSLAGRYEALLSHIDPKIHRGFYINNLDLVFRKP